MKLITTFTLSLMLIFVLFSCDGGDPTDVDIDTCTGTDLEEPTQTSVDGDACGGAITADDGTPTLVWENISDESGYAWEVWTGSGCTGSREAFGTTAANVTSIDVSPPLEAGTYYWRVRALGDESDYCDSDWTCGCPFGV